MGRALSDSLLTNSVEVPNTNSSIRECLRRYTSRLHYDAKLKSPDPRRATCDHCEIRAKSSTFADCHMLCRSGRRKPSCCTFGRKKTSVLSNGIYGKSNRISIDFARSPHRTSLMERQLATPRLNNERVRAAYAGFRGLG